MRKHHIISKTPLLLCLVLPLAACGNSPQEPSGEVDDRSIQSPYLEDRPADPQFEGEDVASADDGSSETTFDDAESGTETDPLFTGAVSETPPLSPITGTWVTDPADCETGGGSTITMTTDRFERVGQSCDIASIVGSGQGSIAITLSCEAGTSGVATSEIVKLAPQNDGTLNMNIVGTEEVPQQLERCP